MKKQKNTGITLIALVVTVIVLLILAGISASMLSGNNGIINKAGSAKEQTESAKEKEAIGTAALQAANKGKFGDITQENLQQQINNEFGEEKNAKVYDEEENFLVLVENRLYKVDKDGNVELSESNFEFPKKEFLAQLSNNELGTSEDKPYEIRCIEDLLDFSLTVNGITIENNEIKYITKMNSFNKKYVSVVKNLDFKLPLSYENAERIDYGDINQDGKVEKLLTELTTGKGWIPIGGYGQNNNGIFNGNFNGNGHKISNLYIYNEEKRDSVAFIGRIGPAVVENINIKANIYCNSTNAAGIIGVTQYNQKGTVKNCVFEGTIENIREDVRSRTAGIIALNNSGVTNIEKCGNKGNLKGKFEVGGIISSGSNTVISKCYNLGNLYSESTDGYSSIGGIAANGGNIDITDCYNTGKVEGPRNVGGITGGGARNVENCYNSGHITGRGSVGGINGGKTNAWNIKFSKCYNTGKIEGTGPTGGICGYNWVLGTTIFEECYNIGEINGNNAAGITASLVVEGSKVCNCYNFGKIKGKTTSGIVGDNGNKIKIISCYNAGELEGTTKYEITNKGIIENCYYISNQGTAIGNALEVTGEQLKTLAPTLDKAYTIDEETGAVTISETEIQNVWKEDTENKNEGFPIFKWQ